MPQSASVMQESLFTLTLLIVGLVLYADFTANVAAGFSNRAAEAVVAQDNALRLEVRIRCMDAWWFCTCHWRVLRASTHWSVRAF